MLQVVAQIHRLCRGLLFHSLGACLGHRLFALRNHLRRAVPHLRTRLSLFDRCGGGRPRCTATQCHGGTGSTAQQAARAVRPAAQCRPQKRTPGCPGRPHGTAARAGSSQPARPGVRPPRHHPGTAWQRAGTPYGGTSLSPGQWRRPSPRGLLSTRLGRADGARLPLLGAALSQPVNRRLLTARRKKALAPGNRILRRGTIIGRSARHFHTRSNIPWHHF